MLPALTPGALNTGSTRTPLTHSRSSRERLCSSWSQFSGLASSSEVINQLFCLHFSESLLTTNHHLCVQLHLEYQKMMSGLSRFRTVQGPDDDWWERAPCTATWWPDLLASAQHTRPPPGWHVWSSHSLLSANTLQGLWQLARSTEMGPAQHLARRVNEERWWVDLRKRQTKWHLATVLWALGCFCFLFGSRFSSWLCY